ncbi:Uncharacterized protein APZ42_020402 [Daphnia magna]|uniref:Uncharacterized protein n=1 Tax=Daphnia magna TaxID=35525 RepID=A0A164XIT5_9CRUS|nr:Uncharacterized protein APZ42_020402 [Daphnia magna]
MVGAGMAGGWLTQRPKGTLLAFPKFGTVTGQQVGTKGGSTPITQRTTSIVGYRTHHGIIIQTTQFMFGF